VITRFLPPEEWSRLDPEAAAFYATMAPEDVAVVVVEEGENIVARMAVIRVPHFESFWMAEHVKGNAGVTRSLLRAATKQARKWAPKWIMANAEDDAMCKTLERLNGRWLPVQTFMLPLREA
jgi:hypothetical protein